MLDDQHVLKVSHSGGKPILFLPDRAGHPNLPIGWHTVMVDGMPVQTNFAKIAVNVMRRLDGKENCLPSILRGWFGHDAGLPGTNRSVVLQRQDNEWSMFPHGVHQTRTAELFRRYAREQIPLLFGDTFSPARWNAGFVVITPRDPKELVLLVTLDKDDLAADFQYGDKFLSRELFQWQSQNRTSQESTHGKLISNHAARGVRVHLFVRRTKKLAGGAAAPFIYCGQVQFESWSGERPITVQWKLPAPLSVRLVEELYHESPGSSVSL